MTSSSVEEPAELKPNVAPSMVRPGGLIHEKSLTWNQGAMTVRFESGCCAARITEVLPAIAMSASPLVTTRNVLPPPPPEYRSTVRPSSSNHPLSMPACRIAMNGRLSTPVAEMLSVSVVAAELPSDGPADSSAHAAVPTRSADAAASAPMTLGNLDIREASGVR